MKIVLGTNVIVSGLLNPYGAPGLIVDMILSDQISLLYDARILLEYEEVLLRPKFGFDEKSTKDFMEYVKVSGQPVAAKRLSARLPDPDDEPFLQVAFSGQAECLVTGRKKHFPVYGRQGIKIVSPDEFIRDFAKNK